MANPRQRRKARSSSHRPVSHSRHAQRNLKKMPPIRGPKILQDAWDKKKTVRQNYLALGLIHDLNPSAAGGSEHLEEPAEEESQITSTSRLEEPASVRKGFGKIIRDEAGKVLRIELAEEEDEAEDELMDEPDVDEAVLGRWANDLGGGERIKLSRGETNVVQALEEMSNSGSGVVRHTSVGERGYLERLVKKHGMDVERMARDRGLNVEQRTAGALRRGLKKAGLDVCVA